MTFKNIKYAYNPLEIEQTDLDILTEVPSQLILWNDEVNTFEWIILSLIELCGHTFEQASNCALIIHNTGKYAVKHGSIDELTPVMNAFHDRGISASIEK